MARPPLPAPSPNGVDAAHDGQIVNLEVEHYLRALQPTNDPVLLEMEGRAERERFPIIGSQVGRLCSLLARSIGARTVFEMGSGFGYSTWWFAHAVGPEGCVVHTDARHTRSDEARAYMRRAGLLDRVRFEVGDALVSIERERSLFDVIFIDVDKHDYLRALDLARPRVRPGGLILVDNALWYGKVARPHDAADQETATIDAFNRALCDAPDFEAVIVPTRDGLAVARRRLPGELLEELVTPIDPSV